LILAGRMCVEEFNHLPCTILRNALGIEEIEDSQPFAWENIDVLNCQDVPVSFAESFSGVFDEAFATRKNGGVVGFVKKLGKGQILMFGATMPANTLGDIDIVHQLALKMGCPSLFGMSDWADIRLSRSENGNFLFINNYQDDPVETTVEYEGKLLFGGAPIHLPARRGAILPMDWQLRDGVKINYVTSEITEIVDVGPTITIKTEQTDFSAELTLSGYTCDHAAPLGERDGTKCVSLHGAEGKITIQKENWF